jgi:hypothetical protein
VPGAWPERLEPQPVQQVVDGLQRADQPELLPEDAADVLTAQRTHAVGVGRPGSQPAPELLLLVVRQRRPAAAPGSVGQGPGGPAVVPGDPGANLSLGQEHLLGHLSRGGAEQGQANGRQSACDLRPRLGPDEFGELVGGVVRLDVHGGLLPGYRQPTSPRRNR